jgi:hypothetical protein
VAGEGKIWRMGRRGPASSMWTRDGELDVEAASVSCALRLDALRGKQDGILPAPASSSSRRAEVEGPRLHASGVHNGTCVGIFCLLYLVREAW